MKFFDFILRNKESVLITLVVHLLFFVYSNIQIVEFKVYHKPTEEIVAILDFTEEEVADEQPSENEESSNNDNTTSNLQNVAVNQTQEKTTYTNSFSKSAADQSVLEELKAMEAAEFAKLSTDNPTLNTTSNDQDKDSNPNLVKEGAEENKNAGFGKDVKATANYQLTGRTASIQKTPSYICKTEGIVRVKIKVNQKGVIVSQEIDETQTNTQDECLRSNALTYVRKWKFNQDFNGPQRVSGWIQFSFVAQ